MWDESTTNLYEVKILLVFVKMSVVIWKRYCHVEAGITILNQHNWIKDPEDQRFPNEVKVGCIGDKPRRVSFYRTPDGRC